jgi:hypothetical protein
VEENDLPTEEKLDYSGAQDESASRPSGVMIKVRLMQKKQRFSLTVAVCLAEAAITTGLAAMVESAMEIEPVSVNR